MRILMAATRRIHTLAVSLHIMALRVGVWGSNRTVEAAVAATDSAHVIRDEAQDALTFMRRQETKIIAANHAFVAAAQAEASSLRRNVAL